LLSRRVLLALLVMAWLPFLVRSVQIYAVAAYPQARQVLAISPRTFQSFIETQSLFVFFLTVYVGSGLIANDRRANALQLYLSKPLLRGEYVAGKLGILAVVLIAVTWVPGMLLLAMQTVLSGSTSFLREHAFLLPAITVAALIRVIVAAVTMLALSALSKSARYVAVLYTGVIFFSEAVCGILMTVTGSTRFAWVSITNNFDVINDAMFQQATRYDTPVVVSVIVLAGLVAVSLGVLARCVRGVEVVS
jgi:ABC-type transport system involved in multi-copper enzyme maturation permease subunit